MNGDQPPPGWWQASDGNWYAPELHPAVQARTAAPEPATATGMGKAAAPRARWFLPVVVVLALVSLYWFAVGVWMVGRGGLREGYFGAFMGLLFGVAAYINYRTYQTRVAPYNRRGSSTGGLPQLGGYEPGGPPRTSGNRWMNWIRYSARLRLLGIVVFGVMIALYDVGLHYLDESAAASIARTTSAQDVPTQFELLAAAASVRQGYAAGHDSFAGTTPTAMDSQPGNRLEWTTGSAGQSPPRSVSMYISGPVAMVAMEGATGTCWFARVDMQVNGGAPPTGVMFAGEYHTPCWASGPPPDGWSYSFPPRA